MAAIITPAMAFSSPPVVESPALPMTAAAVAAEPLCARRASLQNPKDDQNRRSACDRCRRQKLRCERRNSATLNEACKRCLKSRSKCVTGPSLPMGRPRIRTRSTSPFDYRSAARDSIRETTAPSALEFTPMAAPPLPQSTSSPIQSMVAPATTDMSNTAASAMLPPTSVSMMDMGLSAKLMPEPLYAELPEFYPTTQALMEPPPSARREDHVRGLFDVCAQALEHSYALSGHGNGSPWSMGPQSIDSIVVGMTNPGEQGMGAGLSVAQLLQLSNDFLRHTNGLLFPTTTHRSPHSSRHSSIDHTNYNNYPGSGYHQLRNGAPSTYSPKTASTFDDKDPSFSPSSMPSLSSSVASSLSPGLPEKLDFPTVTALYTCYTAILRTYRTLLTRIHVAILSQPMPWTALDSVVPGLYPNGAQIEQRPDLQIKVFLHVCRDLLDQMDKNITLSTKFYHGGAEPDFLRSLLDTLVKGEASEGAARVLSPTALIDEIAQTVDGTLGV